MIESLPIDSLSREIIEALLGSLSEGVVLADSSGHFPLWNHAVAQIFGLGPENVPREKWSSNHGVFRADGSTPFPTDELALTRALHGESVDHQVQFLRNPAYPNGILLSVTGRPVLLADGSRYGAVVVFRDMSYRKEIDDARDRTEALLQELLRVQRRELDASEGRFRSLFDSAPKPIIEFDSDRRMVLVNRQAEAVFGFSRDELLGTPVDRFFTGDEASRDAFDQTIRSLTPTGVQSAEIRAWRKDGQELLIDVNLSRLETEGLTTAILSDMTERRRLEEHVRQNQKMDAVGRLAGGLAHDINNLLTIMRLFGNLAQKHPMLPSAVRDHITQILGATDRAAGLTSQLLTYSRQQVLDLRVADFNVIIGGVEEMLRRLVGEDVALKVVLAPDLGRIKVDPGQMEQVIVNLVANARDAMPRGGTLLVETSAVELDETCTHRHPDSHPGAHVMLAVSDSGEGMDPETLARACEPFFTTKEKGKGTGLGLATVYGIVKQSGGSIYLYSEKGHGTTIKLYFPVTSEIAAPPRTVEPRRSSPPADARILVVEDDSALRSATRLALELGGYTVLDAASGKDALALMEDQRPAVDLLLTDVVLAGMSSRDLVEQLSATYPLLRIVFMSGHTANAMIERGIFDDRAHFLPKPFSQDGLLEKVQEVLAGPRS